ncbi:PaaI family thioesterase [Nocardioides allogilvus]|uniref:PaaI family thioesterase n=1 Tax=Nocardioides allogilvus TaxID=2072017 RepID=UPI000D3155F6|nr:PaaI family thioesterase [Nocardioides allogilvus]
MTPEEEQLRKIAEDQPAFSRFMGITLISFTRDRIVAQLVVRDEMANRNGVLHGGAIMAFADNLGGTAASLNLPPGASTTTMESKTNFLRSVTIGQTAVAECVPLHRGRTTSLWQTTVSDESGRVAAIVTQTQLVLRP